MATRIVYAALIALALLLRPFHWLDGPAHRITAYVVMESSRLRETWRHVRE